MSIEEQCLRGQSCRDPRLAAALIDYWNEWRGALACLSEKGPSESRFWLEAKALIGSGSLVRRFYERNARLGLDPISDSTITNRIALLDSLADRANQLWHSEHFSRAAFESLADEAYQCLFPHTDSEASVT
jgi:hypothetical protein